MHYIWWNRKQRHLIFQPRDRDLIKMNSSLETLVSRSQHCQYHPDSFTSLALYTELRQKPQISSDHNDIKSTVSSNHRRKLVKKSRRAQSPLPPHPSLPLPLPPLLPLPLPPSPSPPLRSRPPKIQLGCLGERCKLPPAGSGAEAEIEFGAF